jgi:hypothetical protein
MFMKNWSRRQKRIFWALVSVFVPAFIGLVGALGSWMNVPEFRRAAGLDPQPASPTLPPVAKASPSANRRSTNRAAPPPKPDGTTPVPETAGQRPSLGRAQTSVDTTRSAPTREERIENASLSGNTFYIDSMGDTSFGIGAQLEGVWRSRPDSIEVEIPRPLLRLHSRAYHKGPRRLDSIKVSIGTFDHGEPWRSTIKRESQAVRVGKLMSPGDNAELGPLRFTIPKKGLSSLSNHQLIFHIENEAVATRANGNKTRSYAYSEAGIFGRSK